MSVEELGKRIAAARAYRGMDVASLADAVRLTPTVLQRFEVGTEDLGEEAQRALLEAVADATRLPIQFFAVDFQSLPDEGPPSSRLAALEAKVDEALLRMDRVVAEADAQMTRGKEQLDRFIETMGPDRELIRKIAAHLGIPT
jgi:transcriptional regulator with XRE-family HTH domain